MLALVLLLAAVATAAPAAGPTPTATTAPAPTSTPTPTPATTDSADGYDPAPFRAGLRPSMAERVEVAVGGLGRLPRYLVEVELAPDLATYRGRAQISFVHEGSEPLGTVVLRAYPNGLAGKTGRRLILGTVTQAGVPAQVVERSATLFEVKLPKPATGLVVLEVQYRGIVPALPPSALDPMGAGVQSLAQLLGGPRDSPEPPEDYGLFASGDGVTNLSYFYPALASRRFDGEVDRGGPPPRGDVSRTEPANFLVAVVAPEGVEVASSGCEVGSVPTPDGRRRTSILAAAHRDVGLAVSTSYRVVRRSLGDGLELRGFSLERDGLQGDRALDLAARALTAMEGATGYPYPWRCMTVAQAALVGGAGGMEFPSLAEVSTTFYRPMPGLAGFSAATLDHVIAHEVAHQWFGMIVGNDAEREPIVDEAITQYATALVAERTKGAAAADEVLASRVQAGFDLWRLTGQADGRADRPADRFASDLEMGALLYGKAPLAFREVRKVLGEAGFQAWLKAYVTANAFRLADRHAMLQAVPPRSRAKVEAVLSRWWDQIRGDQDLGPPDPVALARAIGGGPAGGGMPGTGPGGLPGATPGGVPGMPGGALPGMPGGRPLTKEEQEILEQMRPMMEQMIKALGGQPSAP